MLVLCSESQFEGEVAKAACPFHVGFYIMFTIIKIIAAEFVPYIGGGDAVDDVVAARCAFKTVA